MELEQYALIAEIVSGIAVVASLLYLVKQVRQNTEMLRLGNEIDVVNVNQTLCAPIIADSDIAELWIRAEAELDQLNASDRMRVVLHDWTALQAWHNWFNSRQRNLVSEAHWNQVVYLIPMFCRRQSAREAWRLYGGSFTPEFQRFMAQYME
jgi:hypothetical protein